MNQIATIATSFTRPFWPLAPACNNHGGGAPQLFQSSVLIP